MALLWFAIGVLVGIGLMVLASQLINIGIREGQKRAQSEEVKED